MSNPNSANLWVIRESRLKQFEAFCKGQIGGPNCVYWRGCYPSEDEEIRDDDKFIQRGNKPKSERQQEEDNDDDLKRSGRFYLNGKMVQVKRLAYAIHYRKVPPHKLNKCKINSKCINPVHIPLDNESNQPPPKRKRRRRLSKEEVEGILRGDQLNLDINKSTLSKIKHKKIYNNLIDEAPSIT